MTPWKKDRPAFTKKTQPGKNSLREKPRKGSVSAQGAGHISVLSRQNKKDASYVFPENSGALTAETEKRAGKASGPP